MRVVVITPPQPVVAIEDAKAHLRVDDDDDDTLITGYIAAATAHIDGPDGWLGRALGVQTLEARFDDFHRRFDRFDDGRFYIAPVELPCRPIIEIVSVNYIDQDGAEQTLDPASYQLVGARLERAWGAQWPQPRCEAEAVRVQYQAGYEALPAPIRAAILLMVGDLYSNRETTLDARATGAVAIPMSTTVEALLSPYRVWR